MKSSFFVNRLNGGKYRKIIDKHEIRGEKKSLFKDGDCTEGRLRRIRVKYLAVQLTVILNLKTSFEEIFEIRQKFIIYANIYRK